MLASANRIVRGEDFRLTMRRGRRSGSVTAVAHVYDRGPGPSRFGFVVSKAVGDSVRRHLVTRRLRAIARELLPVIGDGRDVVVRALPGSAEAGWATLHDDVRAAVERSATR